MDTRTNLLNIFPVLATGIDDESDVKHSHDDHRQVDRLVLGEVEIGEHVVPVDRRRENEETTGERRQMRREALCLLLVRQRSNLEK